MLKQQGSIIARWYKNHHRDLPWRKTNDPYLIWVSEIILQQTRVEQGLPYYLRFISEFPNVQTLAKAPEDDILHLWQGLGYYSRARNMHQAAKVIMEEHRGTFPSKYVDIRNLKGIGDYTAAAIASFAFGLPYTAVDGNVLRVIARINGISDDINKLSTKKSISALAYEMMDKHDPATFNQSMMEFGATLCKPKQTPCEKCPLQDQCMAFRNGMVNVLPVKKNQIKVRNRYFHYLVLGNNQSITIKQRSEKDIWQNLWDFPMIEDTSRLKEKDLLERIHHTIQTVDSINIWYTSPEIKHKLSHQLLHITFHFINIDTMETREGWKEININQISDYAFPEVINKYKDEITKRLTSHENDK